MSSYDDSLAMVGELSDALEARAIEASATNDPRSATPPCILITPPSVVFDYGCGGTASWELHVLTPGVPNADAWKLLDEIEAVVIELYPIERRDRESYQLSSDGPALFGYRLQMERAVK